MNTVGRQINRREALIGAGLVGAGALTALLPEAVAAAGTDSEGLQGAWLIKVTPDAGTQAPHLVLTLYTEGGGVAAVSANPPTTGSSGLGAWERKGDNQYLEVFELFTFDGTGSFAGILRIRTLSSVDGDNRIGQARVDFQPPGSNDFFPAGSTHFTGTRIKVVPF